MELVQELGPILSAFECCQFSVTNDESVNTQRKEGGKHPLVTFICDTKFGVVLRKEK